MKVTDQELLEIIWKSQLRKLASDVLDRYCGGSVGVIDDNEHSYAFCSQQARANAGGLTDQLSPSTIKRRIKGLVERGLVKPARKNDLSHTMIDGKEAREAFETARSWWLCHGVPTGYYTLEDGRGAARTVKAPENLESMIQELEEFLMYTYPDPRVS